ncbi:hypothetical protein GCM10023170_088670 [Phytohabitans houttuyneae]|uniref:Uncharacterized protein n=1 Tax=Phytohabitans houttuyneae TaxID=1076126 RepID=A0A6V8JXK1_9ACTN|nr:hypothetical protein Phou_016320 [Phytohabitans houttuyneae]
MTVTVTAEHANQARLAALAAIAAALAPHADLRIDLIVHPQAPYPLGTPGQERDCSGEPACQRWRVPVTVAGYIDVAAGDPGTAQLLALETIRARVESRPDMHVEAAAASCANTAPIPAPGG